MPKATTFRSDQPAGTPRLLGLGLFDGGAVIANVGSIGVIGIAGFALNLCVARFYGLEGLGVFSQALAIFLILGQACAGGFAFSTLHHFSHVGPKSPDARDHILGSTLPVVLVGGMIALILWLFADGIGWVFGSETVAAILPLVGIATLLFGLNKVGGMALNGMGHLKAFALTQAIRLPLMLMALLVLVWWEAPLQNIGWIFVTSELILLLIIIGFLMGWTPTTSFSFRKIMAVVQRESHRGWRGFMIGLLADINTRVDILVLSVFLTDRLVGIYAFGALMAEGVRMLPTALQNVVNPRLPSLIAGKSREGLTDLYRRLARYGRPVLLLAAAFGIVFILLIAPGLMNIDDNRQSALVFTVIALGIVAAAPAIALDQIFSQAGAPGLQVRFFGMLVGANLALNLALVPVLGMVGAALATASVEGLRWSLLNRLLGRHLGLHLWGGVR